MVVDREKREDPKSHFFTVKYSLAKVSLETFKKFEIEILLFYTFIRTFFVTSFRKFFIILFYFERHSNSTSKLTTAMTFFVQENQNRFCTK